MADQQNNTPKRYARERDKTREQVLSRVLGEHDVSTAQRLKRVELLKRMERFGEKGKKTGYIAFLCSERLGASIDTDDIPAFGDVLLSIGDVDQLNLIINSPGGDGTVAEKIIELCRAYCKEFRVIVPNRAKSAATIVALGADQIVMGYCSELGPIDAWCSPRRPNRSSKYCSELGPIDAQVLVIREGVPYYISAQSFIDSRTALEQRYYDAVSQGQDTKAILQQIAVLNAPFIDHCEKLMEFSREVARKYLKRYMFAKVTSAAKKRERVENVLKHLSSVHITKVHGRMIDGTAAKTDLRLNVHLLSKDDPLWKCLWDYYVRADVTLSRFRASKLIESKDEFLVSGPAIPIDGEGI
jgi:hypothetical protein